MDRVRPAIMKDGPSLLLQELGLGIEEDLLLLPAFSRSLGELYEKSRIVKLGGLDEVVFSDGSFRILRQCPGSNDSSWGLIRLRDPAGSIVTCIGFHFDYQYGDYFCELSLDVPQDRLRRLKTRFLQPPSHKLLPFEDLRFSSVNL